MNTNKIELQGALDALYKARADVLYKIRLRAEETQNSASDAFNSIEDMLAWLMDVKQIHFRIAALRERLKASLKHTDTK